MSRRPKGESASTLRALIALVASLLVHALVLGTLSLPDIKARTPDAVLVRLTGHPQPVAQEDSAFLVPDTPDSPAKAPSTSVNSLPDGAPAAPEAPRAEKGPPGFVGAGEGPDATRGSTGGRALTGSAPGEGGEEVTGNRPEVESPAEGEAPDLTVDREAILASYKSEVLAMIETHKSYPAAARRLGQEGEARIRFRVGSNGALSDIELISSSGAEALDQAALDALAASSPLPPIPEELQVESLALSVTLVFTLN